MLNIKEIRTNTNYIIESLKKGTLIILKKL